MTSLLSNRPPTSFKLSATAVRPRQIVLVDDHPFVSSGLSALINHEQDLRVCGIAQEYVTAIKIIEALDPDLVIADLCLRGHDGLELLKDIKSRCPARRVLILSMRDESLYAPRALRAGASGYVMKQDSVESLFTAIRKVLEGEIYLSQAMEKQMLRRLFGRKSTPPLDPLETLTDRELEVFQLIGQARTTREIALELHLSIKTVESYRAHLKKKLNLATASDLLRYALARQQDARGVEPRSFHEAYRPADSWPVAIAGSAWSVGSNTP